MTGENADGYCWCEIYLHLSENIDCPGIGLINQLKLKPPGRHWQWNGKLSVLSAPSAPNPSAPMARSPMEHFQRWNSLTGRIRPSAYRHAWIANLFVNQAKVWSQPEHKIHIIAFGLRLRLRPSALLSSAPRDQCLR